MFKKLSMALVLAAVVGLVSVSSAEAAVNINGNGRHSRNRVRLSERHEMLREQRNRAVVTNVVNTTSDTGKNDANDNTGKGDVTQKSGNASTTVGISTDVNYNTDEGDGCGCPDDSFDPEVAIKNNGKGSINSVHMHHVSMHTQTQGNKAQITNVVNTNSDTGHNDANDNTGNGGVSNTSGNATTNVTVTNAGNSNFIGSL